MWSQSLHRCAGRTQAAYLPLCLACWDQRILFHFIVFILEAVASWRCYQGWQRQALLLAEGGGRARGHPHALFVISLGGPCATFWEERNYEHAFGHRKCLSAANPLIIAFNPSFFLQGGMQEHQALLLGCQAVFRNRWQYDPNQRDARGPAVWT